MSIMIDMSDARKAEVRASPAGARLTASQFDESWALSGILAREIHKSRTFRDKLSDYAHAFARTERFDALRGEEIIRDVFKARFGQTMNQMREGLQTRESTIGETIAEDALRHAHSVFEFIRQGETMPFYRAYDQAALNMAEEHGISEAGAKDMMKDAFAFHRNRELYDAAKETEKLYYKPEREERQDDERKPEKGIRRFKTWSQS